MWGLKTNGNQSDNEILTTTDKLKRLGSQNEHALMIPLFHRAAEQGEKLKE